mgnify:CR=1 FL=1
MSAQLADDSSDGDDANLVGLRALGEDEPLVDPNADTFELDLGAGRRVVIPMDRGAQRRGVAGASGTEAQSETGAVVWDGAVLLARANALEPPGRKRDVLELGAGCGLAGLAWALTEDCNLTLTDRSHRLRALRENAARCELSLGDGELRAHRRGEIVVEGAWRVPRRAVVQTGANACLLEHACPAPPPRRSPPRSTRNFTKSSRRFSVAQWSGVVPLSSSRFGFTSSPRSNTLTHPLWPR